MDILHKAFSTDLYMNALTQIDASCSLCVLYTEQQIHSEFLSWVCKDFITPHAAVFWWQPYLLWHHIDIYWIRLLWLLQEVMHLCLQFSQCLILVILCLSVSYFLGISCVCDFLGISIIIIAIFSWFLWLKIMLR